MTLNGYVRVGSALLVLATALPCRAQSLAPNTVRVIESSEGDTIKMSVSPASAPTPLLRYRMTMPSYETIPGNAASHYRRSLAEQSFYRPLRLAEEKLGDDRFYSFVREMSLDEIPIDELREASGFFDDYVEAFLVPATQSRDCEWGLGEEFLSGENFLQFRLPFMQTSRSIGRVLVLQARCAIAEQDYEKATDRLRMLYLLGHRVGNTKILVCSLIGMAEGGMANHAMLDLMAAPDSPNMYWALASLPDPYVDFRGALRVDLGLGPRILGLENVEELQLSDEEWNRRLRSATALLMKGIGNGEMDAEPDVGTSLAATGLVMGRYNGAKKRLLDAGMKPERIKKMAIGQVVLIDATREYQRIADELEAIAYLPPLESRKKQDRADELFQVDGASSLGLMLAGQILPASTAMSNAVTRFDREVAGMRTIEAIRMHAAQTGELPKTLDEIQIVFVPKNPATDKPFSYRVEGSTAHLDFGEGLPTTKRFEITLAK